MNREERIPLTPNAKRKRKMLLVLPLLVVPFLTLLFWTLGGGKGEEKNRSQEAAGLNLSLPDAALKDEHSLDKLSFYELALKDSIKRKEQVLGDPYMIRNDTAGKKTALDLPTNESTVVTSPFSSGSLKTSPYDQSTRRPEDELVEKLTRLQKELDKPVMPKKNAEEGQPKTQNGTTSFGSEVDRLESLMQSMGTAPTEDPEIKNLETTLDKLLDVQHPERVQERLKEKSLQNKRTVFAVSQYRPTAGISLLDTGGQKQRPVNHFFGLKKAYEQEAEQGIEAVIHQSATIVDGAVVRLRLSQDVFINGRLVPKTSFVYGLAALRGERLEVSITTINHNNQILPVNLEVVDLDGLPGIAIPGAVSRDVVKQSASDATGMIDIGAFDPSLKGQATAAGVSTVKSLLQKGAKLVKVTVKGGYRVILKNKVAY